METVGRKEWNATPANMRRAVQAHMFSKPKLEVLKEWQKEMLTPPPAIVPVILAVAELSNKDIKALKKWAAKF